MLPVALASVAAAGLALRQAADRAAQAILFRWYFGAHSLVQVVGLGGFSALLGCLALCLAFLCVACGTATGYGAAVATRQKPAVVVTVCTGLAVLAGCGLGGALLGWVFTALMALGPRGFCLMGFLLCLGFLLMHMKLSLLDPANTVTLSVVTFITMYVGVWSGLVIDNQQVKISLAHLLLLILGFLMGFLTDLFVLRNTRGHLTLNTLLLVPVTGFAIGLGLRSFHTDTQHFHETYYATQNSVNTLVILSGITGALLGGSSLSDSEAERGGGFFLCISAPTVLLLDLLGKETRQISLISNLVWCLDGGGELGLMFGLTAACGISLGLAVVSALKSLWFCAALVTGAAQDTSDPPAQHEHQFSALMDMAVKFVVMGVVMLGATLLGAAGLLTASLGTAGQLGVQLATLLIVAKGFSFFLTE